VLPKLHQPLTSTPFTPTKIRLNTNTSSAIILQLTINSPFKSCLPLRILEKHSKIEINEIGNESKETGIESIEIGISTKIEMAGIKSNTEKENNTEITAEIEINTEITAETETETHTEITAETETTLEIIAEIETNTEITAEIKIILEIIAETEITLEIIAEIEISTKKETTKITITHTCTQRKLKRTSNLPLPLHLQPPGLTNLHPLPHNNLQHNHLQRQLCKSKYHPPAVQEVLVLVLFLVLLLATTPVLVRVNLVGESGLQILKT
jgi:hypothetical protein